MVATISYWPEARTGGQTHFTEGKAIVQGFVIVVA